MIKAITIHNREDAKKLWAFIKKEVDKSLIIDIELEREIEDIFDDCEIADNVFTGMFYIKLRCRKK